MLKTKDIKDKLIEKYNSGHINDVGYDRRLEDIKERYGESSDIYKNCVTLIESIRKNNMKEIIIFK